MALGGGIGRASKWRWAILAGLAVSGCVASFWMAHEFKLRAYATQETAFQRDAAERANRIADAFVPPVQQLLTVQRLFHAADRVEWDLFRRFVEPLVRPGAARLMAWAPLVRDGERARFEEEGRRVWGPDFAICDQIGGLAGASAPPRDRYFPLLYRLVDIDNRPAPGFDLAAQPARLARVDRAIDANSVTVIGVGKAIDATLTGETGVFLGLPVYQGSDAPWVRSERREVARGLLVMEIDLRETFEAANNALPVDGLSVDLREAGASSQRLAVWGVPVATDAQRDSGLRFVREFELGDRRMSLEVRPGVEWLNAHASHADDWALVAGCLLTLILTWGISARLFPPSAPGARGGVSADARLAQCVEQNPRSIVITDTDSRIEYVNARFLETVGYAREEVIGQPSAMLMTPEECERIGLQVGDDLREGRCWSGEVQTRRRDGSLLRGRVTIAPIRASDGRIAHYLTVSEDISELHAVMARLEDSESRFRGAMGVMIEGLMVLSPENRLLFANRALTDLLGEGIEGQSLTEIVAAFVTIDGRPCALEAFPSQRVARDGVEVRATVLGVRGGDGALRWLHINAAPLPQGDETRCSVVVTFSDVTEQQRAQEELRLAYEAIRHSGEGIMMTDAEHRILSVNPALESVTGYRAEELLGYPPDFVTPVLHEGEESPSMTVALESVGYWQGEVWNRRLNGESYPGWLGVSAVRDDENRPKFYIYVFSDMTERKEAQRRIEFLAHHDPLTGLPNRLLLSDRVAQALAQAHRLQSRVALMFLDLDRFKTINDSLGHTVGDALLKEVVERLKSCVRESDTISRQGGDEFLVLLTDVRDGDAISRVAEKIHQRMTQPFVIGTQALSTSFSIGIASYPEDGDDFDTLLKKADTAMYHAKEAGRNSHRFFTEQMNRQVVEHLALENNLRRALENNEFVLHYQPQLDLSEGRVVGVEALIRWNSPEGLISPARFIPVAESSGLIVPIGTWVLNEACRQARAWQEAGLPPLVMAVNLSAEQFKRPELVNTVINALVLSDLDTHWLELELTESILIQDAETTLATVRRLKTLGVKLSVDDFGTGYSSLAYLKRFAVDKLKIDQSFVRDLETDPDDAAIVRAIIQMAHSLKLKTIAEGVENEELANLLRMFHCDEIQGYWYARPMPAADMEAFLRAQLATQSLTPVAATSPTAGPAV